MKIYTVAIIGGGAAGLLCALRLQERKVGGVVLFERNDRLGRKLSATGNGQGNISNLALSEENYFSSDAAAAFALIRRFGRDELLRYLTSLGGLFSADERGRVYPESRQASSVTDLLRFSLRRGNTEIRLGEYVSEVRKTGELFTICTEKGTYVTEKVVLACGGMAAPYFAFFSGQGRTVPVAVINIFSCLLNILLDYIFIFGKCGLPAYGIFGAGIATSICCAIGMVLIMSYFYLQNQRRIPTRKRWEFHPERIMKLFRFGAPAGFQTFCDVGAFTLVTFLIGHVGEAALAASVIALSINNIFFVPLMGLSDSTAIVVGQYIGRRRHGIAERAVYRAWRLAAIYALIGLVIYLGFPTMLANIFYPRDTAGGGVDFALVTRICAGVLTAAAFFNTCDSIKYIFMGAMRGAGDTLAVFLLNSLTAWLILVPGTVLLTVGIHASIYVVWSFVAGVGFLDAMLFLWRFQSGKWRTIKLIDRTPKKTAHSGEVVA